VEGRSRRPTEGIFEEGLKKIKENLGQNNLLTG
jgi:hypothetical protein